MRRFRTGAAKGEVVGTARINFFASSERIIDACSVDWDGEASFAPLLPAVAFDAVLPTLRRTPGDTEAGPGELWGKHAQVHALTEFEAWLRACAAAVLRGEPPLLFDAFRFESEESQSAPVAQVELTLRLNRGKARVWSDIEASPDDGRDVVLHVVYKVLWNWLVTDGPRIVPGAQLVRRLQSQRDYYRAHGIPARIWMREIGRAPYAAWIDSEAVPLAQ